MAGAHIGFITFPGTSLLPEFVASEQGFFEDEGVSVETTPTPSSIYQITNMVAGKYQVAGTAIDNVIAYQEGQGAVELDTEPDLFVFMGGAKIELSFVVAPEIQSYEDLRGKSLALDALNTGFAFLLYRMIENAGLSLTDDVELVQVGATGERLESMKAGNHVGALLNQPFTGMALGDGFHVLESSQDAFPDYPGTCFAASRKWATENPDAIEGFIRAYLRACDWLFEPANRDAAVDVLVRRMQGMTPERAGPTLDYLHSPATGIARDGVLDMTGVELVLDFRSQYGTPQKTLTDPMKYIDLSYFERARSG